MASRYFNFIVLGLKTFERFKTFTTSFFRHADGVLIVYDITSKYSFQNVRGWFEQVQRYLPETNCVLVGNKIDLFKERVVPTEEAKAIAQEFQFPYTETSAKTSTNVEIAFLKIVQLIINTTDDFI